METNVTIKPGAVDSNEHKTLIIKLPDDEFTGGYDVKVTLTRDNDTLTFAEMLSIKPPVARLHRITFEERRMLLEYEHIEKGQPKIGEQ